jgi:hypothetical protein
MPKKPTMYGMALIHPVAAIETPNPFTIDGGQNVTP